jgi:hypothetical protein
VLAGDLSESSFFGSPEGIHVLYLTESPGRVNRLI